MATTTPAPDDIRGIVRRMDEDFVRNANAGDAARMVDEFYADDAQLLPPNAPKVTGKAAILEFWKAFMAAGPTGISLDTTDISASGDLAYGIGKYGMTLSGARQEGKYLIVLRRRADGSYRTVADMFSGNA